MFFKKLFGGLKQSQTEENSRSNSLAKSRLQFVLVQDRAGMSSDEIAKFKGELMSVIEKYFKVEKNKFDITYKRDGELTTLLINSPVIVKRKRGSEQAINADAVDAAKKIEEEKKIEPAIAVAANETA